MKKLILFFVPLVLLNIIFSKSFHYVMDKSQLGISDSFMNNTTNTDILICGTSHALALQEKQFGKCINVASYGESIQNTYYKISHITRTKKVIPDKIIMSYDLGFLQKIDVDNQPYQYYWNQYENSRELIQFSDNLIDFTTNRISSYLFPYKDGEVDVFDFIMPQKIDHKEALRTENVIETKKIEEDRKLNDSCFNNAISSFGTYYFNNIITLCKDHNIELILIRFPVTKSYYIQQSKCYDPEKYYELINETVIMNSPLISIYDYHSLYDDQKFRDPHHLKGGQIRNDFSQIVINKINESQSNRRL